MTIQHLYPTTRPSLDLNFARQKRLDPRVTFTRGSTATYVGSDGLIKTAASNEARFDHDPVTGESLGLLNEWSRTNLLVRSEEFDNASWTKTNATVTANAATAPDGSSNADKITASASVNDCFVLQNAGSAATHTISCYVKKDTSDWFSFSNAGHFVWFNIGTGALGTVQNGSASIVSVGNGWYRCVWTPATTTYNTVWRLRVTTNNNSPAANGESLYLWGAQLEASSQGSSTSYIPTTSSTVTRAAEVTTMTGTNFSSWYNQTEGTFILDERNSYSSYSQDVRFEVVQNSSPTTNALCFAVNHNAGTRITCRDANTSGTIDQTLANVWTSGGSHKFAYGIQENNTSVVSGTNVATDTSCTLPSNLDSLSIGGQGRTVTNVNPVGRVNISRLTYYPTRLTDAQLQALTL